MQIALDFSCLNTPPHHGDLLIEPPFNTFESLVQENISRSRGFDFSICGDDYSTYRQEVRDQAALSSSSPVVAVGHQPEFFHCGVWAKSVVCHRLAERLGARGVQVLIDYDRIKARHIVVPYQEHGHVKVAQVPIEEAPAAELYEQLTAWSEDHTREFSQCLSSIERDTYQASMMPLFLKAFRHCRAPRDWVSQYAFASGVVDREFGIELAEARASLLDYGRFFAELISQARRFASAYNGALAAYRRQHRIKGNRHPMPDLDQDEEKVELPVWISAGDGARQRLYVGQSGDRLSILAGDELVQEMPLFKSWPQAEPLMNDLTTSYELRPRALAFTLWARLLLCDLFIHGIGGAKYDQITDRIIRDYFGVQPPHYACVSATMLLDLPRHEVTADDVRKIRHRLRDMRYNPQRYVVKGGEVGRLIAERESLITEGQRLRRESPHNHHQRLKNFQQIRSLNEQLAGYCTPIEQEYRSRLPELEWKIKSNAVATSREYFYGLFTSRQLANLQDILEQQT